MNTTAAVVVTNKRKKPLPQVTTKRGWVGKRADNLACYNNQKDNAIA